MTNWQVSEKWCDTCQLVPYQHSGSDICFLQDLGLMDKGKTFSTIKMYLAAISAPIMTLWASTPRYMEGGHCSLFNRRLVPS